MEIDIEKEIKDRFSMDLILTLKRIGDNLVLRFPSIVVTVDFFLLAVFESEKTIAGMIIGGFMTDEAIKTIYDGFCSILEKSSIVAVKPKRKIKLDAKFIELIRKADEEAKKLGSESIDTSHMVLAILNPENGYDKIRKVFDASKLSYEVFMDLMRKNDNPLKNDGSEDEEEDDGTKAETSGIFSNLDDLDSSENIKRFCVDINKRARNGKVDPIIGREKEIESVVSVLNRRKKNNVVLVGEGGVGKTAICEGLAWMIVKKGLPFSMRGKRIMRLDSESMVAGTSLRGMFEDRVKNLFSELSKHPEIVLFIDDIHNLSGDSKNSDTIIPLLGELLSGGRTQVIATTTYKGYHDIFEFRTEMSKKFQKVVIEPNTEEESIAILGGIKKLYEKHHRVKYTDEAIETCVRISGKYISDRSLPDSAIDIMDETATRVSGRYRMDKDTKNANSELEDLEKRKAEIMKSDDFSKIDDLEERIAYIRDNLRRSSAENIPITEIHGSDMMKTVEMKTGIPVARMTEDGMDDLRTLGERIKKGVIGQDEAVDEICRAIRRKKIGVSMNRCLSMMLIGPTGVGKTLVVKKLAKDLFGSEKAMVRLDMSEYSDGASVGKLIGAAPGLVGYESGGQLTEAIKTHRHCILLLDEIEKASRDVYNLFLQVLDEGFLTDSHGEKVDFKNVIIFMTSNVGASEAAMFGNAVGFSRDDEAKRKGILSRSLRSTFPPEFLNRIDSVIYFSGLERRSIEKVIELEMGKLMDRVKDAGYSATYDGAVTGLLVPIVEKEKEYGGRAVIRTVQNEIETRITDVILEEGYDGHEIRVFAEDGKIKAE